MATPAPSSLPSPIASPVGKPSQAVDVDAQLQQALQKFREADAAATKLNQPPSSANASSQTSHATLIQNKDGSFSGYDPELVKFQTHWTLGFSSGIAVIVLILLWRKIPADSILRALMIPVIIGTASILVIAGYGKDQITPVVGLLGTVAGYILGQTNTSKNESGARTQSETSASTTAAVEPPPKAPSKV